jgi:ABC-2 type transport system ATP-binding protein
MLAAEGITVLVSTHYMDEAERCHRLAYIAYGKLLITGTAEEVIAHSKLTTWAVSGPGLFELAAELRNVPAIKMVVPFGSTLHVSGTDAQALDEALAPFRARAGTAWTPAQPGLEDVFIRMMDEAPDNFDA